MTYHIRYKDIPIPPLPPPNQILDRKSRLKCFFFCLESALKPANANETLELINRTIVQIEDNYSGVPINLNPSMKYDGRMYPIQEDYIERKENGAINAMTKGNKINIEPNGSFTILDRVNDEILLKIN